MTLNILYEFVKKNMKKKMKFVGIQCAEIIFCKPVEINSLHDALELGAKMYNSEI